ncbi:alpha/beta fold hydrolase [Phenylobacterium sp.]|uniref:alpha/beta fold hydrolase n=1 Tax=Phenylobacterium sp. TaxID=1871053 RepID=UPI002DEAAB5B|nr:alpha/beta fold hydrolase [Phenylobacterium sp.]
MLLFVTTPAQAAPELAPPELTPHDFTIRDFHFRSGEALPELRLHYYTLGQPHRDAAGHIDNAVMILHGTGGSGRQFAAPQFADVLFKPGGLLDPARYFIILPDDIGHGGSSKPSDGLRAHFPHYDYADMVEAEHALAAKGLGVQRLRLVMGASMGCMHAFMWGEAFPDQVRALMPLACLPVEIAGRNRLWRQMVIDAITTDPAYAGGDYREQPVRGLTTAEDLLILAGASPLPMQIAYPTGAAVKDWYESELPRRLKGLDANDLIYQVASSRTYDPSRGLEKITVPITWVNSADDFINPPELGIARREAARLKKGQFVLIPAGPNTHGHGTHTWAALWQAQLAALLARSGG